MLNSPVLLEHIEGLGVTFLQKVWDRQSCDTGAGETETGLGAVTPGTCSLAWPCSCAVILESSSELSPPSHPGCATSVCPCLPALVFLLWL